MKFCRNKSNYYDEMNIRRQSGTFQSEEDSFTKNVQGFSNFYHEVMLLLEFLQTKLKFRL